MIRFVEENQLSRLYHFCAGDPFGCRIASLALAYGLNAGFAEFWLQYTELGEVCAAVSRLNGAVTLQVSHRADPVELETFLSHIGYGTLVRECGQEERTGTVMEWTGEAGTVCKVEAADFAETPSLSKVYDLLDQCQEEGFQVPAFESFYVDVSHRLRHHTARVAALEENGRLLACGLSLWETTDSAVLGAVAAAPEARGKGLGSAVVLRILEQQPEKKIFVFRAKGKNRAFYQRLGFVPRTYFREGIKTDVGIFSHRSQN